MPSIMTQHFGRSGWFALVLVLATPGAGRSQGVSSCDFEAGSQGAAFATGSIAGQGTPAWSGGFVGWDGATVVVSGQSYLTGSQSMQVSGYNSGQIMLAAPVQNRWVEFAFKPNFTSGTPGTAWFATTRGENWDAPGVSITFSWNGTDGTIRANTGYPPPGGNGAGAWIAPTAGTVIGSFTNGQWHSISVKTDNVAGTYDIYTGSGNVPAGSFAPAGFDGVRTLVWSATTGTWEFTGSMLVDGLRVGSARTYAAPANLLYGGEITGQVGVPVVAQTPSCDHAPTSFSVEPALPVGLSLDPAAGTIGGTPTLASSRALYTVTASNAWGSTTAGVWIAAGKALPVITTTPAASVIVFGQPLAASLLTGGGASVPGTFVWTDPDTVPTASGSYPVTFFPADAAAYDSVATAVPVSVGPAGGGTDPGTVYYSADFEPGSQGAAFAPGPVAGQGAPAWGGYFASGYDEAGAVAAGVSHNGGAQSMQVSGYRTSVLTLSNRISEPVWLEFAFRPNFTPGTPGTAWALTTRGDKSDAQGIKMGLEWDGSNGMVRVGSRGAGFESPGTVVGSFTNGQWQTVSFAAALGLNTYEVYLGGNYTTTMTVAAGYEGIRSLVFSSATQSWSNTGDWYVDGIRLASRSLYTTTGSTFAWSTSNPTYPVTEIAPGILHSKFTVTSPRRMAINVIRVDTAHPGIRFRTSGRHSLWGQPMPDYPSMTVRTRRQTTRDFLSASRTAGLNMVVAVNAAPWEPWATPFNHQYGDKLGLAVSDGVLVSDGNGRPSFIVRDDLAMEMRSTAAGTGIAGVAQAVSGFEFVLFNGVINGTNDTNNLNPRTALGLSGDRRYFHILTIDGRRPGHSDGATHHDLGRWLRDFGAWQAINMDGGGSTTLFSHHNGTANLLNWPSGSERANGNNLGVYYDTGPVQPVLPAASWPVAMADWLRYRGVPAAQSSPSADAAGDGIPNLLKYAWNIDPLRGVQTGDPNGQPPRAEMTTAGGSPAFCFRWRRNRQATGVDLFPQSSHSLAPGSWSNLPSSSVFQTGQDPVTGDTLYEVLVDPASAPKMFLRLEAQGSH